MENAKAQLDLNRTVIRSLLELTPGERARLAVQEAGHLDRALAVAQKRRR